MNVRYTTTTLIRNLSVALAAALVLAGAPAGAAGIKVGSLSFAGSSDAGALTPVVAARELAAKHVNEQGGLFEGDAYRLIHAASQCDPEAAVESGKRLVEVDQVIAIVGPTCSGPMNALARQVAIPAGVVVLSGSATAPSISKLDDDDLAFRVVPSDIQQGPALARFAWDAGYRKLAVAYANDDYNAGLAEVFVPAFEALGGSAAARELPEPREGGYRSEIEVLAAGGAEALAIFAYPAQGGIAILRESLETGLFDRFVGGDGMLDDTVIEEVEAGALRGKVMLSQPAVDTQSESYRVLAETFSGAGPDPAGPFVAHAYDIAFLMALAIEKAGSPERSGIAAALREVANAPGRVVRPGEWAKAKAALRAGEDIDYRGGSGPIEFDENGDVVGMYVRYGVGDDGTWEITE